MHCESARVGDNNFKILSDGRHGNNAEYVNTQVLSDGNLDSSGGNVSTQVLSDGYLDSSVVNKHKGVPSDDSSNDNAKNKHAVHCKIKNLSNGVGNHGNTNYDQNMSLLNPNSDISNHGNCNYDQNMSLLNPNSDRSSRGNCNYDQNMYLLSTCSHDEKISGNGLDDCIKCSNSVTNSFALGQCDEDLKVSRTNESLSSNVVDLDDHLQMYPSPGNYSALSKSYFLKTCYITCDEETNPKFPNSIDTLLSESEDQKTLSAVQDMDSCQCHICGILSVSVEEANQHLFLMHDYKAETKHTCDVCKAMFNTARKLRNHSKVCQGTEARKHPCELCGEIFDTSRKLKSHSKRQHKDKRFECDICQKMYDSMSHLMSHYMTHTGDRPTTKVPVEYKEQKCSICGRHFNRRKYLRTHMLRIHKSQEDKPHGCDVCGKRFDFPSTLSRHTERHTEDRPSQCSQCNKRFKNKSDLLCHIKIHSVDRKYKCGLCDKDFYLACNLKAHVITHTKHKPFKCGMCDRSFTLEKKLKEHLKVHVKVCECDLCGRATLKGHYESMHGIHTQSSRKRGRPRKCVSVIKHLDD